MFSKLLLGGMLCVALIACASFMPNPGSGATPMLSQVGAGYIDVDHPPTNLTLRVGETVSLVRSGGVNGGTVTVTTYNTDGQNQQLLIDLGGGPIGTIKSFRANRKGTGRIVIQYSKPIPGGFAQSVTINVTVR